MGKAEVIKEKFEAECLKLRELDKRRFCLPFCCSSIGVLFSEQAKYLSNRRLLETQLTENKMVKDVRTL